MQFRVVLLLLFLVREWNVAEADCSKKLFSNATGVTFTNCTSKKYNEEGKTTPCEQTCVFEGKRCALFKVPDDVEYIEIVNINIPTCAKATIENIVDSDGKCINLTLGRGANGKENVIIKLKSPGGKFRIRATSSSVTVKFITIKDRQCAKMKMPANSGLIKRIVDGTVAEANEFPFIVRLTVYYSPFNDSNNYNGCNSNGWVSYSDTKKNCVNNCALLRYRCGGSILNKDWILSAQHCFTETEQDEDHGRINLVGVLVRAGDHKTTEVEDEEKGHWVPPANIKRKSEYNKKGNFNNDMALLKVNIEIPLDPESRYPICLPPSYMDKLELLDGCAVQAAGWGRTERGVTSDVLVKGNFTVVSNKACKTKYAPIVITDKMICIDHEKTITCTGDSGGPVFLKSWSKHFYQVGVISFGILKTKDPFTWDNTFPVINARVTKFIDWIKENVGAENLP